METSTSTVSRLVEWFWQGQSLKVAQQEAARLAPRDRLLLEQARALFDLGERVRVGATHVTARSEDGVAMSLFHQAAILALETLGGPAGESWARRRADIVRQMGLDRTAASRLDQIFPAQFSSYAALTSSQLHADANLLERVVRVLVADIEASYFRADFVRGVRFVRSALLITALIVTLIATTSAAHRLLTPPNLLEGKAWQTSSTYPGLNVNTRVCDGKSTAIFFHTKNEPNPWVQFDIGKVSRLRRVEVRNRTDYGTNRVVPLAISLSQDGHTWTEVGRNGRAFREWSLDFPPTDARYVRAQTLATTWLHLEWIKAR